jgi:hypothetical protein
MRAFVLGMVLAALVSCTSQDVEPNASPPTRLPKVTQGAPCPVTVPDGSHRAADSAGLGDQGFGGDGLWVGLWPNGRTRATDENVNRRGEIEMKFPWDRGIRGRLDITGRRLDADAPPLRSDVPDYGPTGFQATALIFPTEGCWEVTGTVRNSSVTFVTKVTLID